MLHRRNAQCIVAGKEIAVDAVNDYAIHPPIGHWHRRWDPGLRWACVRTSHAIRLVANSISKIINTSLNALLGQLESFARLFKHSLSNSPRRTKYATDSPGKHKSEIVTDLESAPRMLILWGILNADCTSVESTVGISTQNLFNSQL